MVAKKVDKKRSGLPKLVDLTDEEVLGLSKPRDGFQAHAEVLLAARGKFGSELSSAKVDEAKVREHLAAVAQLDEAIAGQKKHLEMLEDTRKLFASYAWNDLLEIYGVAQVVAKKDAKVAKAIEPFVKFMSIGPKKKKGEGETK